MADKKSTSLCLFGYTPVSVKDTTTGGYWEYKSIFSLMHDRNYKPTLGQNSVFWRSLIRRQWQYDNFEFNGGAAAEYIPNAHRYRIQFNPYEVYKSAMCWEAGVAKHDDDPKIILEKENAAWNNALKTGTFKGTAFTHLSNSGWNHNLALLLQECYDKKQWTREGWQAWTSLLSTNMSFSHNVVYIMMHEVQHIVNLHLIRIKGKDSFLWNVATDFSINQNLPFSHNWAYNLITTKNLKFMRKMNACICKWLCKTNQKIKKELGDLGLTPKTSLIEYELKLSEMSHHLFGRSEYNFVNKSADFYYEVYKQISEDENIDMPIVKGGSHNEWANQTSESNMEEENSGSADGVDKERSSGEQQTEHTGFDESIARNEAKESVRKSLEMAGYDPDSEQDIERALRDIPSISAIGHMVREWFKVKKSNWKRTLATEMRTSMNSSEREYTMKREHKALDGIFPGKIMKLGLDIVVVTDTSGSVGGTDWNDFANQMEYIARDCEIIKTRVIQCHTKVCYDEIIRLKNIKKMSIKEVGGTTMKVAMEYLKLDKNRKTCILFTDGAIDVFKQENYPFKIIIFLSRGNSHYKKILSSRGFRVICQDEE